MQSISLADGKNSQALGADNFVARCRFCDSRLDDPFLDLGVSPLANSYLRPEQLGQAESFYPLRVYVCRDCLLVQLEQFESPEHIFSEYSYFSSYSDSWLRHAEEFAGMATKRFGLGTSSQVVEIASNDGYLLQYFLKLGLGVLGVEPAKNVAKAAMEKGISTIVKFFGTETATEMTANGVSADLIVGNNVFAHVPALNDFVEGLRMLLKPHGVVTLEFPHLMRLMDEHQFDTIYHEHFSYFSLATAERVCSAHGLKLFDVDELPTHGGSLRIYLCRTGLSAREVSCRVEDLKARERACGLDDASRYAHFADQVKETKRKLLDFMIMAKRQGKSIAAYGAPAKGNTLLNYCGIRSDFI